MKDIKLSFPYPKTSRHNLSQDVGLSLSMGLVTPVRVVEVLPGDSHRISTSFSLISNPLVKPLLQGVRMRYCRFWVPRRIYHLAQRANNSDFDPRTSPVRYGVLSDLDLPAKIVTADSTGHRVPSDIIQSSNFQASSLFDYLGIANFESNVFTSLQLPTGQSAYIKMISGSPDSASLFDFNAEPYLAYVDICRNYFADSATGSVAWSVPYNPPATDSPFRNWRMTLVSPLSVLDDYIDKVQNSEGSVSPYDPTELPSVSDSTFNPLNLSYVGERTPVPALEITGTSFSANRFGISHAYLCVPSSRPDRFSRVFDTRPLTSQNATISSSEITIANLSFLAKLQRYLTRKFFGGSRYTDVMYSIFGQKVPHVDSPVCLDVFDYEIGSELVASTNASESQNPGVLGGYFSSSGYLSTHGNRHRKRYTFNEAGYLIDLVYISPRVFRSAFVPDFYPVSGRPATGYHMAQGNFIPDLNGIGWQQPAYAGHYVWASDLQEGSARISSLSGFSCEPSWQQYRTLPDVCHGLLNLNRGSSISNIEHTSPLFANTALNMPLFVFNDRSLGRNVTFVASSDSSLPYRNLFGLIYTDFNLYNSVFGYDQLTYDNIFCLFRYAHQAKRQVSKRFTLSF